jgi:nifR3 family TIM-barrel protein
MPADFPLFLAPMAGVTNTVFRRLCKAKGADVLTTEFVSAEGILHRNERTRRYLEFHEEERPLGVQLFGGEPERLAEAVRAVRDWVRPDFLDLNFGCPVNKVVSKNGGSALLKDCPLLVRVAEAVVAAADPVPVTAKIRIGWDRHSINAVRTARLLEECGVSRIAVHGRTKEQGYSGEADWSVIGEVAAAVKVPVIGNGDINCAADVLKRRAETGVAGVMIGRAAMAHPWIFSEIRAALTEGTIPAAPSLLERWEFICAHCVAEIAWRKDERMAMKSMRSRLMAYTKGMAASARLRARLSHVESLAALEDVASDHIAEVTRGEEQGPSETAIPV